MRDASVFHEDDAIGNRESLLLVVVTYATVSELALKITDFLSHATAKLRIEIRSGSSNSST